MPPMPLPSSRRAADETDGIVAEEGFRYYDLTLRRKPSRGGAYFEVAVLMKLHFLFREGSAGDWAGAARAPFVRDFKSVVRRYWTLRGIGRSAGGARIDMEPTFETRIDGTWPYDHWEVVVYNQLAPGFRTNADGTTTLGEALVNRPRYALGPETRRSRVRLTNFSNDARQIVPGITQYTSVHEYGHMIDGKLTDEYEEGDPNHSDTSAVLNSGTVVRARNVHRIRLWAVRKIAEYDETQALVRLLESR